ncbi:MAG: glycosyltransferase family A protein [Gemmatimonadota bacterium]
MSPERHSHLPPEIGVVIPFYRADRTFPATLASVLAQTRRPDRIVVVDDGSPDGESRSLAALPDGVELIRLPRNAGVGEARRVGMAAMPTPLIAFLDADDGWPPNFLEAMSARLVACAQAPAVYSAITRCWPDGPRDTLATKPSLLTLREAIVRSHTIPSAMLFRRAPLEAAGGWPPERMLIEDWVLIVRLIAQAGPLVFAPEIAIDYAVGNPGSINSRDWFTLRRWYLTVRLMHETIEAQFGAGSARRRFAQALADRADRRRGASRRFLHGAARLLGPPLRDG